MSNMETPRSGSENVLQGKWKQLRGKVREKWGQLTDDDLDVIDGRRERLIGTLQERYGRLQKEIEKEVDDFIDSNRHVV